MAATRMKSAGNVEPFIARPMVTLPSSIGWRRTARVLRLISGMSRPSATAWRAIERMPLTGEVSPVRANSLAMAELPGRSNAT